MLFLGGGVPLFWSTYTHTHDRLDNLCSALAEAQLKTHTWKKRSVKRANWEETDFF